MRFILVLSLCLISSSSFASRDAGTDMRLEFPELPPPGLGFGERKPFDWAQPPLGCVEEMVPHEADRACLDLSRVANPLKEWPADLSLEDKQYWFGQRRGLDICRAKEIFRREKENPGSMNPVWVELAWMNLDSLRNREAKINAVYKASRLYGVPLHVLTGAVYQESLFSELGIASDGGNYSCGVQQINLFGWCQWANAQSSQEKKAMDWPQEPVNCNDESLVRLSFLQPIYNIAVTRLKGLPEYRLAKEHFANIPLEDFVNEWPAATKPVQQLRYRLIQSFLNNCSDAGKGILAKANELSGLYGQFVSSALKAKDRYPSGQSFNRQCRETQVGNAYPLHTGWLMAVASYNAGPRAIDAVAHYNEWSKEDMNDGNLMADFRPSDLIRSLYWGGKYNPSNDLIEFNGLNGGKRNWIWFKGCVAQRHIARVMQHVTLVPDFFVDSLENGSACAKSVFGSDGKLIRSAVPLARQQSSGVKGN